MRRFVLVLLAALLLVAPAAQGAFYRWVDANGVVHFTDSRKNIPQKYQKKATRITVFDDRPAATSKPAAPPAAQSRTAPPPAPAAPGQPAPAQQAPQQTSVIPAPPGGHDEQWWRERFAALRAELKLVQDGLFQKQAQLAELRRRRAIYMRASDREAINATGSAVSADEARLNELLGRIDALEQEANRAGVPVEWRQ